MLCVKQEYCLGCGTCIIVCPVNKRICPEVVGGNGPDTDKVIMLVENGVIKLFHPELCEQCHTCTRVCPTKAIYHREGGLDDEK